MLRVFSHLGFRPLPVPDPEGLASLALRIPLSNLDVPMQGLSMLPAGTMNSRLGSRESRCNFKARFPNLRDSRDPCHIPEVSARRTVRPPSGRTRKPEACASVLEQQNTRRLTRSPVLRPLLGCSTSTICRLRCRSKSSKRGKQKLLRGEQVKTSSSQTCDLLT